MFQGIASILAALLGIIPALLTGLFGLIASIFGA
jgi:hypothetical protein